MSMKKILVVSDSEAALRELITAAKALAETVEYCCPAKIKGGFGATRISYSEESAFVEAIPAIVDYAKQSTPDAVLVSATQNGRLLAGNLSFAFNTSALCDSQSLEFDGEKLVGRRMVYGGAAHRTESSAVPTAVAIVSAGAYGECDAADASDPCVEITVDASAVKVEGTEAKQVESVNLPAAKTLICVGRGFAALEELKLADDFAAAVGGEVGCTRPISEGEGWMSSSRYVGISGLMLSPDVYFSFGISGQVQHMVGVNPARIIVAVNKDANAPIFKQCDLGLVAEVQEALPKLTEILS